MPASENKVIVRRYFTGRFEEKNYDVVDQFSRRSISRGQKAWLDEYHASFTDSRTIFEHIIAEDDLVVVHYRAEVTHSGEVLGFPPSVSDSLSTVWRFVDSRTAKSWKTT